MGSPRCTATTETARVPTAATAPQARTESGFVIFGQTLSARLVGADCRRRLSVEHCGESFASAQSQSCDLKRYLSDNVLGRRGFGDTLFLPNDCQPRVGDLIWFALRRGASGIPSDFIPAQERKMKIGILTGGG